MKKLAILTMLTATGAVAFLLTSPSGKGTIIDAFTPVPAVGAEGGPSRDLNATELARWIEGRRIFDHDFGIGEGLGLPEINGDSCRACHQMPVIGGAGGLDVNVFRFGDDGFGTTPFTDLPGGQVASKVRTPDVFGREEHATAATVFEQRQTPTLFGLGLIDAIAETTITAGEDPTDADGDGIFGVARRVTVLGNTEIGRFGWKSQIPRLSDFIKDAMGGELGITTPDDGRGFAFVTDNDGLIDPEIFPAALSDLLFYMSNLAAPPRQGTGDAAQITQGEAVFNTIGCAKCHTPMMPSLLGDVNLFSDLLLHNVQPANFRGMAENGAGVGFYRTPPLWGISKSAPYFHDGRAETLLAAVVAHTGEATNVLNAYAALSQADQDALIAFLGDL